VQGTYHEQYGDGYLFAIAKRTNGSASTWLVSDPVEPSTNGHWVAHILIGNSSGPMTVLAVLAGGCLHCAVDMELLEQELQRGPGAADYSTGPVTAQ
jgi:hypothetical protein